MLPVTVIAVGQLKERYFKDAADEYKKRLSGSCRITEIEIKEEKTPDSPSESQITAALKKEAERILDAIPKKACIIPMCIEGKQLSSEELADHIEGAPLKGFSSVCFIIGSSHGLSDEVKRAASLKLPLSKMTFPHKLARVMLYEQIYRAGEIISGSKYHK